MSTRVRDGRVLGLTQIDVSVFSGNIGALGSLHPDEAVMVTQVYKLVLDINRRYAEVSKSEGIADDWARMTGMWLGGIVGQVRVTLRGLRETAGMPEEKAQAAMAPWTPVLGKNANQQG
jgi:hypothetical protein